MARLIHNCNNFPTVVAKPPEIFIKQTFGTQQDSYKGASNHDKENREKQVACIAYAVKSGSPYGE